MALSIDTRQADDVTVLDLSGDLMFGPPSQSLAHYVKQLTAGNPLRILVNLDEVTCIDSCGVGELIASFTSVKKSGGVLKVSGPSDRVSEVLRIVRLPAIVDVYDTEDEALASFSGTDSSPPDPN